MLSPMLQRTLTDWLGLAGLPERDPDRFQALCRSVAELSRLFTKDRAERQRSYLDEASLRAGYLAYFLPVNLAKVQALLDELPPDALCRPADQSLKVLDVGSGPGTGALAVLDWMRLQSTQRDVAIVAIDQALPALQEALAVPIVGVLVPEAHAAVQATRNRRIGLLATEATVASGRYEEVVHALDAGARVVAVPCPKLVPLIEAGDVGEELDAAVREYASPLREEGVDTVILGCTHYPIIRRVFERAFGRGTTLVYSADETAREVAETLARKRVENDPDRDGSSRFLTTGSPEEFRTLGERFLQLPIPQVEQVSVRELELAAA